MTTAKHALGAAIDHAEMLERELTELRQTNERLWHEKDELQRQLANIRRMTKPQGEDEKGPCEEVSRPR